MTYQNTEMDSYTRDVLELPLAPPVEAPVVLPAKVVEEIRRNQERRIALTEAERDRRLAECGNDWAKRVDVWIWLDQAKHDIAIEMIRREDAEKRKIKEWRAQVECEARARIRSLRDASRKRVGHLMGPPGPPPEVCSQHEMLLRHGLCRMCETIRQMEEQVCD